MEILKIVAAVVVGLLGLVAIYAGAVHLHWRFVGRARWEARVAAEEAKTRAEWEERIAAAQAQYEEDLAVYERQNEHDRREAKRAKAKQQRIAELRAEYDAVCGWYVGRVVYETDRRRQQEKLEAIKNEIEMVKLGYF